MKKDMKPINEKEQAHGYWKSYHTNGEVWYKGHYINGNFNGYWVWYDYEGKICNKEYHIN